MKSVNPVSTIIGKLPLAVLATCVGMLFGSCNNYNEPATTAYNTNPIYGWGYCIYYGQEYLKYQITNSVLSLSLFTDSLSVDSTGSLAGTGQYLHLEAIYIDPADVFLPEGEYTVGTNTNVMTIERGKNDSVDNQLYPVGSYIYYVESSTNTTKRNYIISGSMTVSKPDALNYNITCNFVTADKKALKGTYKGKLAVYDFSLVQSSSSNKLLRMQSKIFGH